MNTNETNKVYSPLWHQIYAIVRTGGDYYAIASEIEGLLAPISPSPMTREELIEKWQNRFNLLEAGQSSNMVYGRAIMHEFIKDIESLSTVAMTPNSLNALNETWDNPKDKHYNEKQMSSIEWFSVKNPPEEGRPIILWDNKRKSYVPGYYRRVSVFSKRKGFCGLKWAVGEEVTHWCYFPAPPIM